MNEIIAKANELKPVVDVENADRARAKENAEELRSQAEVELQERRMQTQKRLVEFVDIMKQESVPTENFCSKKDHNAREESLDVISSGWAISEPENISGADGAAIHPGIFVTQDCQILLFQFRDHDSGEPVEYYWKNLGSGASGQEKLDALIGHYQEDEYIKEKHNWLHEDSRYSTLLSGDEPLELLGRKLVESGIIKD